MKSLVPAVTNPMNVAVNGFRRDQQCGLHMEARASSRQPFNRGRRKFGWFRVQKLIEHVYDPER